MEKKTIGKGLAIVLLGVGAFGFLAGPSAGDRTVNIPFPERSANPHDVPEAPASPRECDLQRGIESRCTFL
jgi:hypothetical protein